MAIPCVYPRSENWVFMILVAIHAKILSFCGDKHDLLKPGAYLGRVI